MTARIQFGAQFAEKPGHVTARLPKANQWRDIWLSWRHRLVQPVILLIGASLLLFQPDHKSQPIMEHMSKSRASDSSPMTDSKDDNSKVCEMSLDWSQGIAAFENLERRASSLWHWWNDKDEKDNKDDKDDKDDKERYGPGA
jgi:hypothetical protein